ncbi:MAG: hypothetical protein A2987_00300 [Omnitrophica bacterium RIFCSPLOWO2_01_FULL_45_10]|nr:MAG: hypothetical protein A2987_00300 [Omnitrophica bacterium RIFCSPLOWO2_01_FULL_45_10]
MSLGQINREKWDKIFMISRQSGKYNKYPAEHIVVFMAKNYYKAPSRDKIRVLEIGCGSGCNLRYLCEEGFKVYGIDHSIEATELSVEYLKNSDCTAEISVQCATSLSYEDNFFNVCLDNNSIHCNTSHDIGSIFNEILRVLKPGGKFFGIMASDECDEFGKGKKIDPLTFDFSQVKTFRGQFDGFPIIHFFSKKELEELGSRFSYYQLEHNLYTLETGSNRSPLCYWFVEFVK